MKNFIIGLLSGVCSVGIIFCVFKVIHDEMLEMGLATYGYKKMKDYEDEAFFED